MSTNVLDKSGKRQKELLTRFLPGRTLAPEILEFLAQKAAPTFAIAAHCAGVIPPEIAGARYVRDQKRGKRKLVISLTEQICLGARAYVTDYLVDLRKQGLIERTGDKVGTSSVWKLSTKEPKV